MISGFEIVLRLLLAAVLGGLIGMEREVNNRPAGLRTHVLVTLGSALIMLVSIDGFYNLGDGRALGDPARLASQVVSGIGFLGAGTIMRTGNSINGLTTAASLWVSAGIGLAIGSGYYLGGIVTVGIVLIALTSLGVFEKGLLKKKHKTIEIIAMARPGLIGNIGSLFGRHYVSIKDITISEGDGKDEDGIMEAQFLVSIPNSLDFNRFYDEIYQINGITSVVYEGRIMHNIYNSNKHTLFDDPVE